MHVGCRETCAIHLQGEAERLPEQTRSGRARRSDPLGEVWDVEFARNVRRARELSVMTPLERSGSYIRAAHCSRPLSSGTSPYDWPVGAQCRLRNSRNRASRAVFSGMSPPIGRRAENEGCARRDFDPSWEVGNTRNCAERAPCARLARLTPFLRVPNRMKPQCAARSRAHENVSLRLAVCLLRSTCAVSRAPLR